MMPSGIATSCQGLPVLPENGPRYRELADQYDPEVDDAYRVFRGGGWSDTERVALPRIAVAVIPHLPSLIRAFGLPDRPMPAAGDPAHRRLYLHQPIAMPRKFPS
ncbi:hypothetical protein ACU4HD_31495 [Cupriavidus basilensis]